MRILLTNDDGYQSQGINQLFEALVKAKHTCVIVAPDKDQSGVGSCVKGTGEAYVESYSLNRYKCNVTPVSCINVGMAMFKDPFDCIISGINEGLNTSGDIFLSGTVNAAKAGSMYGIPSIAVSMKEDENDKHDFTKTCELIVNNIERLVKRWDINTFYNINTCKDFDKLLFTIPYNRDKVISTYKVTRINPTRGYDSIKGKCMRGKRILCKYDNPHDDDENIKDINYDLGAINNGHASISVLKTYSDSRYSIEEIKNMFLRR